MASINFAALRSFQAGMRNNNLVYLELERVYLALFSPQPVLHALLGATPHNGVWLDPLKEPPSLVNSVVTENLYERQEKQVTGHFTLNRVAHFISIYFKDRGILF